MYFLDTCILIDHIKGERKVERIIGSRAIVTSKFQLMEMYYVLLKEADEEMAEKNYEAFSKCEVEIEEKTIKNAMKTKFEMQKHGTNISYVDAIGYQYALDNDMYFVTSDPAFKKLKKVEYIPFD